MTLGAFINTTELRRINNRFLLNIIKEPENFPRKDLPLTICLNSSLLVDLTLNLIFSVE
jgi:hypothetical protein